MCKNNFFTKDQTWISQYPLIPIPIQQEHFQPLRLLNILILEILPPKTQTTTYSSDGLTNPRGPSGFWLDLPAPEGLLRQSGIQIEPQERK
jgi:hypothetical protein